MSETYSYLDGTITEEVKRGLSQPNPTVEAINALRSAVVAQTTLLRSLSEQVRLNQEAIVNWFSLNREQQAKVNNQLVGLAERLEKLDQQDDRFLVALEQVANGHKARPAANGHKARPAAIEGKLPASEIRTTLARKQILLKDLQPKRAAARRKAKR